MLKGKMFGLSSGQANKPKDGRNYREISWLQCQCSGSSQIPSQDDLNYHQFLSLYKIKGWNDETNLIIYDTESEKEGRIILDTDIILDESTSITQLPNGELFCYGNDNYGIALIIDRNYRVRMLPFGTPCNESSALYFDNNIYCFGGYDNNNFQTKLSRKFDLRNKRWINLAPLPKADDNCHSVICNRNILISINESKNLLLYSIEIDSFTIIPYEFEREKRKFLINAERLYLIEWDNGLIYESECEYHWKPVSKTGNFGYYGQTYCLYNKEKIYISTGHCYYQFDLQKKVLIKINNRKI